MFNSTVKTNICQFYFNSMRIPYWSKVWNNLDCFNVAKKVYFALMHVNKRLELN